ncbi:MULTISPECIES: hypothetical protein [unclassified Sphingobium]|uniref:hypothetical protein n=1 Tax=unclassified Sphingobium TaxID=2611147 RepID=UPI0022248CB6|nr:MULTISPECIES: hypothetical protein [unclassified Sphingobium]MCW2382797.1 hypothetical protein [Sphingobium sp. B2D3B]MCW2397030.1 hypothetical protein [Sphingobium sp. B2D3C]
MSRRTPLGRIFAMPLALALLSIVGLVSALTGDGWADALSWIALAAPLAATLWAFRYHRS